MVTTIIHLTKAFFGGGDRNGSTPGGGKRGVEPKDAVKEALEEYVKAASYVLLRLKVRHNHGVGDGGASSSSAGGFKFFCMYAFLDKFVEQCPQVCVYVFLLNCKTLADFNFYIELSLQN